MIARIVEHTKRYEDLFYKAIHAKIDQTGQFHSSEPIDVIVRQRLELLRLRSTNNASNEDLLQNFPKRLLQRFNVLFKPLSSSKAIAVRDAKSSSIGHLITVRGIVTRVTDVRPQLVVATYTCSSCGCEIFQEVPSDQFLPVAECPSDQCKRNNVKGELTLQTRGSHFVRYQQAKIQELVKLILQSDFI